MLVPLLLVFSLTVRRSSFIFVAKSWWNARHAIRTFYNSNKLFNNCTNRACIVRYIAIITLKFDLLQKPRKLCAGRREIDWFYHPNEIESRIDGTRQRDRVIKRQKAHVCFYLVRFDSPLAIQIGHLAEIYQKSDSMQARVCVILFFLGLPALKLDAAIFIRNSFLSVSVFVIK